MMMTMIQKVLFLATVYLFLTATQGLKLRLPTKEPFTRRPGPSVPPEISEKACREVVHSIQNLSSKIQGPICLCLNETQLLNKLKDVGGYNPRYVAVNRSQACEFTDLTQDLRSLLPKPQPQKESQNIPHLLRKKRQESWEDNDDVKSDLPRSRVRRMVPTTPGSTVVHGCWGQNTLVVDTNRRRMCTECSATTYQPSTVFPPFVNEVLCHPVDRSCSRNLGQCIQRVIEFTFLRRTGNFVINPVLSHALQALVYIEEWDQFPYGVGACCECQLIDRRGK